jgi:hypothetical protein
MTALNAEQASELFEIRCRGAMAEAFHSSGVEPTSEQWKILRGERELTLRDIAEIGFATDVKFAFSFHDIEDEKTKGEGDE